MGLQPLQPRAAQLGCIYAAGQTTDTCPERAGLWQPKTLPP